VKKFVGHTDLITHLEMNPIHDEFMSCSRDMTLRLWNLSSPHQECTAILDLSDKKAHCVAAFDPTGVAFAVSFQEVYAGASLCRMYLYDTKKFDTVTGYDFHYHILSRGVSTHGSTSAQNSSS
jgi:COMPASS component SWD2